MNELPWMVPGGQQVQFTPYQIAGRGGGSAIVTGNGQLQSQGFVAGSSGWCIYGDGSVEFNNGNFRGDITGATGTFSGAVAASQLDIGGDDATSFHVDSAGGIWSGASIANKATAPFRVSSAGALVATSGTFTGGTYTGTGTVSNSSSNTFQSGNFSSGSAGWRITGDGNVEFNSGTFRGAVDIGGDDATSFHVDSTGGVWIGASTANKATAPITISNVGRFVANDAASGAQVIIDAVGSGAYLGFDSGHTLQVSEANVYNYHTSDDIILQVAGGDTTDVATIPVIYLISDTILNEARVELQADRVLANGPLQLISGSAGTPSLSFQSDTSFDTGFYRSAENEIAIASGGAQAFRFTRVAGEDYFVVNVMPTSASGANVFYDTSTGHVRRSTSSREFKHDIEKLDARPTVFDSIPARRFKWNQDIQGADHREWSLGFVIEELAEVSPELVDWVRHEDGALEPINVDLRAIVALLVDEVQGVKRRLTAAGM